MTRLCQLGRVTTLALLASLAAPVEGQGCVYPDQPAKGQVGTRVTIQGTTLLGQTAGTEIVNVTLGGIPAEIVDGNETHVIAVSQNGYGTGDILITSNTGAEAVFSDSWE